MARGAIAFAFGAMSGLAVGVMLPRRREPGQTTRRLGNELRARAKSVARRLRPARLRRMAIEQDELSRLEDAVLDAFLADRVLSERGIDVGAISEGIIELSGSVWTRVEAEHAIDVAENTAGVHTVVNRMEIEEETQNLQRARDRLENEVNGLWHEESRVGGMGARRESHSTDPDRPDESQHSGESALEDADRDQWQSEGLAHSNSKLTERPEVEDDAWRLNYRDDELDNQNPHEQGEIPKSE